MVVRRKSCLGEGNKRASQKGVYWTSCSASLAEGAFDKSRDRGFSEVWEYSTVHTGQQRPRHDYYYPLMYYTPIARRKQLFMQADAGICRQSVRLPSSRVKRFSSPLTPLLSDETDVHIRIVYVCMYSTLCIHRRYPIPQTVRSF